METLDIAHDTRDRGPDVSARAAELMPGLVTDLKLLIAIPSVASPGFPAGPLFAAHDFVVDRLREAGLTEIESLTIEGKTAPVVVARVPAPPGAPTVLLYTHYDVVPAGDEALWRTPAFEAVERDGALYGRGAADSKANVMSIIGALKVFGGRPPVGVTVVVEGQEEVGSPFDTYPPSAPEIFRADAMIIADVGSVRPGTPTLTVALRGSAQVDVEVRTLAGDKHSGQYGGAAPDARTAMIRLLATLHDAAGDVAVPGLRRTAWTGATYTDAEFRELAEILPGVPQTGTGGLGERIWSGPAITVIAFDAPPTDAPMNAVAATARATLNLRVHPQQDAAEAQRALVSHLLAQRPFGITATVTAGEVGNGFAAELGGPGFDAAMAALGAAWEAEPVTMAGGGSIPLVMALHEAIPAAEKLLFGATDSYANIHAPNERVLLDEFARSVVAKATFFTEYARRFGGRG
ncbi:MAG TPA: M20/M25/M40 family metallo-hydrolase [Pilimelia sp.]|nr:M20/M25/M40 family metallo-hydrolase [Pilimelia sp.]